MKQEYRNRFKILKGGKISLIVSALCMHVAVAAPQGGNVVSGSANINQNGDVTNIHQSSQKASINWNSFNVSKQETVNFNQPNKNAITLNRVVGNERSVINGALNANGQVWILNSNGVLFGKNARVNTAGLLATTREISDQDFQAGNYKFVGDSDESVINLGEIEIKDGGYAALLGKSVSNEGTIKAIKGRIELVGAQEYLINLNGNSLVNVKVEKSVVDALVENKGLIKADGGKVYLTTSSAQELIKGVVNNSGVIEANSIDDITSEVILFAHGGRAEIAGRIEAREGFVETSGKEFSIEDESVIRAGYWLIDPVNITIDDNLAGIVETALSSGDVEIKTDGSNTPDTSSGEENGEGNIFVESAITWNTSNILSLEAYNNLYINEEISATDEGSIELYALNGSVEVNAEMSVIQEGNMYVEAEENIIVNEKLSAGENGVFLKSMNGNIEINHEMEISDGGKLMIQYDQDNTSNGEYYINAPVNLDDGQTFSTQKGSETQIDYTVISDATALENINSDTSSIKYYALGKDIDLGGNEFTPINEYRGHFDALGNKVRNLKIDQESEDYIGFFKYVNGATIRNLGIEEFDVKGSENVGALAGRANSSNIINSYVSGTVKAHVVGADRVGGLVGYSSTSKILKSSARTIANGTSYVGGLVGRVRSSEIKESYSEGEVAAEESRVGGLAGSMHNSIVEDSYSKSNVEGTGAETEYIGGLVGRIASSTNVINSNSSGNVSGYKLIGGLVGFSDGSFIKKNSYSSSVVEGNEFSGGLVGKADFGSIQNSYSTGSVTGTNNVGGLVGRLSNGTIESTYSSSTVVGNDNVGGLVGSLNDSDEDTYLNNSYSIGNVTGNDSVGGLVGLAEGAYGEITSNYSLSQVEGNSNTGGYLGKNNAGDLSIGGFFLQEDGGINASIDGIGDGTSSSSIRNKSEEELQDIQTYLERGWDIEEDENISQSQFYPVLSNDPLGITWKIRKIVVQTPRTPVTPEAPVTPEVVVSETNNTTNTIQRVVTAIINKKAVKQPDVSVLKIPKLQVSVNNLKVETPSYNAPTNIGETTVNRVKIVSSPQAEETTTSVTQTQVQTMQNSESTVVPVDKDSLVSIVDSGVNLPEGMEQVFFVVPEENE